MTIQPLRETFFPALCIFGACPRPKAHSLDHDNGYRLGDGQRPALGQQRREAKRTKKDTQERGAVKLSPELRSQEE